MTIQNLSQFKKALTLGSKWHCVYHLAFDHREPDGKVVYKDEDKGIREVKVVQSNAVAFEVPGKTEPSWLWFGKASEWKFENNQAIFFTFDTSAQQWPAAKTLTYTQA